MESQDGERTSISASTATSMAGSAKPLAHMLNKPMPLCLGHLKSHLRCPVQKYLDLRQSLQPCFFHAITMSCIMTDSEPQLFRFIPRWKYDPPSDSFHIGRGCFLTPWAGLY
jgi:hypothetical protein